MRSPHVTAVEPSKTEEAQTTMIQAIHLLEMVGSRRRRKKRGDGSHRDGGQKMELNGIRVGNSIYEAKYDDEYDQDDGSWYQANMNNW